MIKNIKLNKNIVASLLSFSIITTSLIGCNKNENIDDEKNIESQEIAIYFLKNNKDCVIIETIDLTGNKDINFAKKIKLSEVYNPIKKVNKYSDYCDMDKAFPANTYLYLDLDGDVLAVRYTVPDNIGKGNANEDSYGNKEIINEIPAYDKIAEVYGEKTSYQKEEIELIMESLKKEYKEKVKIK